MVPQEVIPSAKSSRERGRHSTPWARCTNVTCCRQPPGASARVTSLSASPHTLASGESGEFGALSAWGGWAILDGNRLPPSHPTSSPGVSGIRGVEKRPRIGAVSLRIPQTRSQPTASPSPLPVSARNDPQRSSPVSRCPPARHSPLSLRRRAHLPLAIGAAAPHPRCATQGAIVSLRLRSPAQAKDSVHHSQGVHFPFQPPPVSWLFSPQRPRPTSP